MLQKSSFPPLIGLALVMFSLRACSTPEPTPTSIPPSATSAPPTNTPRPTNTPPPFVNALAYELPDMDKAVVRSVEYRTVDNKPLTMDVYYPHDMEAGARLPVVIFVMGYTDSAAMRLVGSALKDYGQYVSWGRLTAAAGLVAVTYQTRQADDLEALVDYIRQNGESLNMDGDRIGLWSSSANVPTAESFAMQENRDYLNFAVFYYGHMLTPDNHLQEEINGFCKSRGCYAADPSRDLTRLKDVEQLRTNLPLLVVKAGDDSVPYINDSIDHFVEESIVSDVTMTLIEHTEAEHGFDEGQATERSSEIIEQTLEFMKANLAGE